MDLSNSQTLSQVHFLEQKVSRRIAWRLRMEALLANGPTQQFIAERYNSTSTNLRNSLRKLSVKTSQKTE